MLLKKFILLFFIVFNFLDIKAQDCADSLLYKSAFDKYQQGNFDSTIILMNVFINQSSLCSEKDSLLFYEAKYTIADSYLYLQKPDSAIAFLNYCLPFYIRKNKLYDQSIIYSNFGTAYHLKGNYREALKYQKKTLQIDKSIGEEHDIATDYNNIAALYAEMGIYDSALTYYQESLELCKKLVIPIKIGNRLNNIGHLYSLWGFRQKAIDYYLESFQIFDSLKVDEFVAMSHNNLGESYSYTNLKKAKYHYDNALAINIRLKLELAQAINWNNLGGYYRAVNQYDSALVCYKKSRDLYIKNNSNAYLSSVLNNIGTAFKFNKQYDSSLYYFNKALELSTKLNQTAIQFRSHNFLGEIYLLQNKYKEAIECFNKALEIVENIRHDAPMDVKKEFLADQITIYENLIFAFYQSKQLKKMIDAFEMMHARSLIEQLKEKSIRNQPFQLSKLQQKLKNNQCILLYSFYKDSHIIVVIIDNNKIEAKLISLDNFCNETFSIAPIFFRGYMYERISSEIKQDKNLLKFEIAKLKSNPETYFLAFRTLLSQSFNPETKTMFELISQKFFNLLLLPVQTQIEAKTSIIIVPDGVLSYLPFETLINTKNKYLVETHNISYIPSLTLLQFLAERSFQKNENDVIVFGNPIYDKSDNSTNPPIELNEAIIRYVYNKMKQLQEEQKNYLEIYRFLGYHQWNELPGTMKELEKIKQSIPTAKILQGKEITESNIKQLSQIGELSKYAVLHWATHGISFAEIPEFSALVLSNDTENNSQEDNYLTMQEIASLHLKADFVNLSACETGLGKIYKGEGVFGISQSFLLAGANNIAVSLWKVDDEATGTFMGQFYEHLNLKEKNFASTLNQVKRDFISKPQYAKWSQPYYWAAFVFYGK